MKTPLDVRDWDTIPPVVSLRRTAILLGTDPDTVKRWAAQGDLEMRRAGPRNMWITKRSIRQFLGEDD